MQQRPGLTMSRRTLLVLGGFGLFDLWLMTRAAMIQGLWSPHLRRLAEEAHLRGIPLAPLRGDILDVHGRLLAGSENIYSAYAVPVQVRDPASEALLLSTLFGVSADTVRRRLERHLGFVWIRRRLTANQVVEFRTQASALPGVHLVPESTRYYPEGDFAGQVLGFTGIDNQGLAGLEYTYNRELRGRRGWILHEYASSGQPVQHGASRLEAPVRGDTLWTTLDENIQWMAEQAAEDALARHSAKRVMVVVMDPSTGGILALVNRPGYNPNRRPEVPAADRDYAVSDAIPPGSIFKPVTLATALESGAATPASGFFCPGFKIVLGRRVNCWRRAGHGPESLSDVVKNSCNVGFMTLGLAIGMDRFYSYLDRFRVMGPSGIDLPGEARGILPSRRRATQLDLAVMAFGQTLTTVPVALANAIAALANGGELLVPHVGERLVAPDGRVVRDMHRQVVRRVVRPEVAAQVQRMMARVVSEGTGKNAQVPGYRVAGKTGTAEKVVGGRVVDGVYIASFVGFAPVPNPRVLILCSVDEPQGAYYGGQVAAPVVGRLLRQILAYWKVPATVPRPKLRPGASAFVPNLVNLSADDATHDAEWFGFVPRFRGRGGTVVDQSVEYGGYRPAGSVLDLTLGTRPRIYMDWVAVPEVVGLPVAQARHVAFDIGINLHVEGNLDGRVQWQQWPANHEVRAGSTMPVVAG
jgi:stage V sporulation protein D (sporulation-specific penicillin-binding protein)